MEKWTGNKKGTWGEIVLCPFCEGKEKKRDSEVLFVGYKNELLGVRGSSQTRERKNKGDSEQCGRSGIYRHR